MKKSRCIKEIGSEQIAKPEMKNAKTSVFETKRDSQPALAVEVIDGKKT